MPHATLELPDASSPSVPPAGSPTLVHVPRGPPPGFPSLRLARDFTYVYTRRPCEPPAALTATLADAPVAPGAPSAIAAPAAHDAPLVAAATAAPCHTLVLKTRAKSSYVCPGSPHILQKNRNIRNNIIYSRKHIYNNTYNNQSTRKQ